MKLIKKGDKVGASEATLLNMLKISPFTYGLLIEQGMLLCCVAVASTLQMRRMPVMLKRLVFLINCVDKESKSEAFVADHTVSLL